MFSTLVDLINMKTSCSSCLNNLQYNPELLSLILDHPVKQRMSLHDHHLFDSKRTCSRLFEGCRNAL